MTKPVFSVLMAAMCAAMLNAATVRMATESFVVSKIAEAMPGNYAAVSNAAMSALQPGEGGITSETDPTVHAWAKAPAPPVTSNDVEEIVTENVVSYSIWTIVRGGEDITSRVPQPTWVNNVWTINGGDVFGDAGNPEVNGPEDATNLFSVLAGINPDYDPDDPSSMPEIGVQWVLSRRKTITNKLGLVIPSDLPPLTNGIPEAIAEKADASMIASDNETFSNAASAVADARISDALNRTNMSAFADDVAKTNGSLVGRVYQLEQAGPPMWDLEITYPANIGLEYRGAWNLRSVTCKFDNAINVAGEAFAYLPNLETVIIPNCSTLGWRAFYNSSIRHLVISNGFDTVGSTAYWRDGMANLETLELYNLRTINSFFAADLSPKLKYLAIPNATVVKYWAFRNNKALERIDVSGAVELSGFGNCSSLRDLGRLDNVEEIEEFFDCISLERIPDMPRLRVMRDNTFKGCTNIVSFGALTNCEYIGGNNFQSPRLTTIGDLPKLETLYGIFGAENLETVGAMPSLTNCYAGIKSPVLRSVGNRGEGIIYLPECRSYGSGYAISDLKKIYAIDMPKLEEVMGCWNIYNEQQGTETPLGRMHFRFGALSKASYYTTTWHNLIYSWNHLGVMLVNLTRAELMSLLSELEAQYGFHVLFGDYELQNHIVCNDDPEWSEWNTWFDNACPLDAVPQWPLSR